jgi:hypothetical protein
MTTAASASHPPPLLPRAAVPVRSPRTSIILAELARQRRLERRRRRLKRQRRRQAWVRLRMGLPALGQWSFEPIRTCALPGLLFVGTVPLICALQ